MSIKHITFIFACIGPYSKVVNSQYQSLICLESVVKNLDSEIIIALDNESWLSTPFLQTFRLRFPRDRFRVIASDCRGIPAELFNKAAEASSGRWLHFSWPGIRLLSEQIASAAAQMDASELDWFAYIEPMTLQKMGIGADFVEKFGAFFMSCARLFSLAQALIRADCFRAMGCFNTSPVFQRFFDVEFFLRAFKAVSRRRLSAGRLAEEEWNWDDFPLRPDMRIPRFVARSFSLRTSRSVVEQHSDHENVLMGFVQDLPIKEAEGVAERCLIGRSFSYLSRYRRRYKVAVTGGLWDYVHNRLCFFNHFESLEAKGYFTYIPLQESLIEPQLDLCGVDLVIISRGKVPNVLRILDYCELHGIPTLYMIDDNWLTISKDYPEIYGNMFSEGCIAYNVFMECLRRCNAVIVYNDIIASDIGLYAKHLLKLPVNVRLKDFEAPIRDDGVLKIVDDLIDWRKETKGVLVGYAGSIRYSDAPFRALAAVAKESRYNVRTVLFGFVSDVQLNFFTNKPVMLPYMSYEEYATVLGRMRPDILIAPLEENRSSMSKCPNKYLEYSAAGAAGVYSQVYPYTAVIEDGQNGLLVSQADELGWKAAVMRLVEDRELRERIGKKARADVKERFDTEVVAPLFAESLLAFLEGRI